MKVLFSFNSSKSIGDLDNTNNFSIDRFENTIYNFSVIPDCKIYSIIYRIISFESNSISIHNHIHGSNTIGRRSINWSFYLYHNHIKIWYQDIIDIISSILVMIWWSVNFLNIILDNILYHSIYSEDDHKIVPLFFKFLLNRRTGIIERYISDKFNYRFRELLTVFSIFFFHNISDNDEIVL